MKRCGIIELKEDNKKTVVHTHAHIFHFNHIHSIFTVVCYSLSHFPALRKRSIYIAGKSIYWQENCEWGRRQKQARTNGWWPTTTTTFAERTFPLIEEEKVKHNVSSTLPSEKHTPPRYSSSLLAHYTNARMGWMLCISVKGRMWLKQHTDEGKKEYTEWKKNG